MAELTRQQAQARADQVRSFQRELAQLQDEGVLALDVAQQAALRERHERELAELDASFDLDRDARTRDLSRGMRIASFLGALALAASVYYLFARFWGRLDLGAQASVVLLAAFGSFLATMALHRRDADGYFTKLASLVAFTCFVLDLVLLGDLFNITPSPTAFLAWSAYALLLAYACEQRLMLLAAIGCLACFLAAIVTMATGSYWSDFGGWPESFLPVALLLFALPALVDQRRFDGFAATWRVCGLLCCFLPVMLLSSWGGGSRLGWAGDDIEVFYQVVGFVVAAAAIWLGIRRRWNDVANTGVVFFVAFLFLRFFDWWWDSMPKYLFFLLLALVSLLLLSVMRRLRALQQRMGAAA